MKQHGPFTAHPASVGETYGEHFAVATGFGWRMVAAGLACLIHGVFPFLFVKTGSQTVTVLHERMVRSRIRHPAPDAGAVPAE